MNEQLKEMSRPLPGNVSSATEALGKVVGALEHLEPARRARVLMAAWVFFICASEKDEAP